MLFISNIHQEMEQKPLNLKIISLKVLNKWRLEKVISLQKKHSIKRNQHLIGSTQKILVEKQSKMSSDYWAGRTDSNKWVIFKKESQN